MPAQVTVSDVAETTGSGVDRRLLIDGRLVTTDKALSSIDPATGEVAVPVVGGGE
jgi:aldehyde dehydrogenase (NAD+)